MSCTKVYVPAQPKPQPPIIVKEPQIIRIPEIKILKVPELVIIAPHNNTDDSNKPINSNAPETIRMLILIKDQQVMEHGIIYPESFGQFVFPYEYVRHNGYTTVYLYSNVWDVKYALNIPWMNGEHIISGSIIH